MKHGSTARSNDEGCMMSKYSHRPIHTNFWHGYGWPLLQHSASGLLRSSAAGMNLVLGISGTALLVLLANGIGFVSSQLMVL